MATKKTSPSCAALLAKTIDNICAADAIYKNCQAYPFRLYVSGLIQSKDVQDAVAACREVAYEETKDSGHD